MKRLGVVTALLIATLIQSAFAQRPAPNAVSQALEQEMKRAFQILKDKGDPAPYFISYSVRENQSVDIGASLGALNSSQKDHSRVLDIDVRVGDYDRGIGVGVSSSRGTSRSLIPPAMAAHT